MRARKVISRVFFVCVALSISFSVGATPEDDYQKGYTAYHEQNDLFVAMNLFKKAAKEDHVPAMMLLAHILYRSNENVEAALLYQRAGELGDSEAKYNLGMMYMAGEGVKKDIKAARKLVTEAANMDNSAAMVQLVKWYERGGAGYAKNNKTALTWLVKAVKLDNFSAMDILGGAFKTGQFGLKNNPKKAAYWAKKAVETRDASIKSASKKQ